MALSPRESARFLGENAKHVSISLEDVRKAAHMVIDGFEAERFSMKSWKKNELNPKDCSDPFIVDWIFFVDTLNFSFWSEEGSEYKISYRNKTYSGYWSLCAAVNRAMEEGCMIVSPSVYSTISFDDFRHVFRSDSGVEIPLLEERYKIITETGKYIMQKFKGTFQNVLKLCDNKAEKLLKIVVENFPSYRDEAVYESKRVSFYKRAQILIGDLWACFEGEGCGAFEDIDSLTIFADYRVPQVLLHLGVLRYSEELLKMLESGELLKNGDCYEVEIRGCAIWAVELMMEVIKDIQRDGEADERIVFNAVLVDFYLWEYRRKNATHMLHTPFHRTRCIYY